MMDLGQGLAPIVHRPREHKHQKRDIFAAILSLASGFSVLGSITLVVKRTTTDSITLNNNARSNVSDPL